MIIDSELDAPSRLVHYVVSGPSGSGKTSLCVRALRDLPWLRASVSHTTRPPRVGEVDGTDYFFVDRRRFQEMVRRGEFLEWAEVHGECYGTANVNMPFRRLDRGLLFEVDCQGAMAIQAKLPCAVLIFVMTPSFPDLVARIRNRGPVPSRELAVRIRTATEEIRRAPAFQYVVINDRFDDASLAFQSILWAEQCRANRVLAGRDEAWEEEIRGYGAFP